MNDGKKKNSFYIGIKFSLWFRWIKFQVFVRFYLSVRSTKKKKMQNYAHTQTHHHIQKVHSHKYIEYKCACEQVYVDLYISVSGHKRPMSQSISMNDAMSFSSYTKRLLSFLLVLEIVEIHSTLIQCVNIVVVVFSFLGSGFFFRFLVSVSSFKAEKRKKPTKKLK